MAVFCRCLHFAMWAAACEPTLWKEGTFQAAYSDNIDGAMENVIEADPVACAVRDFMADRDASGRDGRVPSGGIVRESHRADR